MKALAALSPVAGDHGALPLHKPNCIRQARYAWSDHLLCKITFSRMVPFY